jgi:hypothetical protein
MNQGWIKLHRKLRDNPWMSRPAYRSVWIELLLEAQHQSGKKIIFKGKSQTLLPGQLTTGLKQLSQWTGVPRGTVQRILKTFKNETMIETLTSNEFTLVTLLNWESYQNDETPNETPVKLQRNSNETPVGPPKECNNDKNDKNEKKLYKADEEQKIQVIFETYKRNINPRTVLTQKSRQHIHARLQEFSEQKLHEAIARFFFNKWRMENNAEKGMSWFFSSEDQIAKFLSLKLDRHDATFTTRHGEQCTTDQLQS